MARGKAELQRSFKVAAALRAPGFSVLPSGFCVPGAAWRRLPAVREKDEFRKKNAFTESVGELTAKLQFFFSDPPFCAIYQKITELCVCDLRLNYFTKQWLTFAARWC